MVNFMNIAQRMGKLEIARAFVASLTRRSEKQRYSPAASLYYAAWIFKWFDCIAMLIAVSELMPDANRRL